MTLTNKKNNTVSVITPTFNSARYIRQTLASIERQTYEDWEVIIVDDNSGDETTKVVSEFISGKSRFSLIKLSANVGAAQARNHAIGKASGRYLAFLDSDDVWDETKLEKQVKFMKENSVNFSFTSYYVCDRELNYQYVRHAPPTVTYSDLLGRSRVGCLTVMLDRKSFQTIQMPEIKKRQDLGLWLKLLRAPNAKAYGMKEPLASYRKHDGSLSSNKFQAIGYTWLLYRKFEKLSFFLASYFFIKYLISIFHEKVIQAIPKYPNRKK